MFDCKSLIAQIIDSFGNDILALTLCETQNKFSITLLQCLSLEYQYKWLKLNFKPTYQLEKSLTARVKNGKCLWQMDGTSKKEMLIVKVKCIWEQNDTSRITPKFAVASYNSNISQVKVISKC